jgi:hypothetical protein
VTANANGTIAAATAAVVERFPARASAAAMAARPISAAVSGGIGPSLLIKLGSPMQIPRQPEERNVISVLHSRPHRPTADL